MSTPAPVNLRCEYSSRPMGIDTPCPRFSWQVHHRQRGQLQQCYQILVSQEPEKISDHIGDAWDSGKIDSSDTVNVEYDGLPLCSASAYFWRVRWWDLNGNASPYSDISCFETALLTGQEWQAECITMSRPVSFPSLINTLVNGIDEQAPQYHAMYLRKVFGARDAVKRGRAFVTGIGYYEFRLNGHKVGDHLLDDGVGGLRPNETTDQIHLSAPGYHVWVEEIRRVLRVRRPGPRQECRR